MILCLPSLVINCYLMTWQGLRRINEVSAKLEWTWVSGVVYTMVHEVVPRPCKICDWLLNSPWDHFALHQGINVRVTMKFEVPKRHILRPTLSTDMVQRISRWERQKRCSSRKRQGPMAKKCCDSQKMTEFFLGEDKMKTREWSNLIWFSKNC